MNALDKFVLFLSKFSFSLVAALISGIIFVLWISWRCFSTVNKNTTRKLDEKTSEAQPKKNEKSEEREQELTIPSEASPRQKDRKRNSGHDNTTKRKKKDELALAEISLRELDHTAIRDRIAQLNKHLTVTQKVLDQNASRIKELEQENSFLRQKLNTLGHKHGASPSSAATDLSPRQGLDQQNLSSGELGTKLENAINDKKLIDLILRHLETEKQGMQTMIRVILAKQRNEFLLSKKFDNMISSLKQENAQLLKELQELEERMLKLESELEEHAQAEGLEQSESQPSSEEMQAKFDQYKREYEEKLEEYKKQIADLETQLKNERATPKPVELGQATVSTCEKKSNLRRRGHHRRVSWGSVDMITFSLEDEEYDNHKHYNEQRSSSSSEDFNYIYFEQPSQHNISKRNFNIDDYINKADTESNGSVESTESAESEADDEESEDSEDDVSDVIIHEDVAVKPFTASAPKADNEVTTPADTAPVVTDKLLLPIPATEPQSDKQKDSSGGKQKLWKRRQIIPWTRSSEKSPTQGEDAPSPVSPPFLEAPQQTAESAQQSKPTDNENSGDLSIDQEERPTIRRTVAEEKQQQPDETKEEDIEEEKQDEKGAEPKSSLSDIEEERIQHEDAVEEHRAEASKTPESPQAAPSTASTDLSAAESIVKTQPRKKYKPAKDDPIDAIMATIINSNPDLFADVTVLRNPKATLKGVYYIADNKFNVQTFAGKTDKLRVKKGTVWVDLLTFIKNKEYLSNSSKPSTPRSSQHTHGITNSNNNTTTPSRTLKHPKPPIKG